MKRRGGTPKLWTRLNFSVKFALIIAVAGVLISIIPLSLASRENSLQASQRAADKAGIVVNLVSGQQRSLTAFASGMAQELSTSLNHMDLPAVADTLQRYSQVNNASDVVGVAGELDDAAVQADKPLQLSEPLFISLSAGVMSHQEIVPGPNGAPWLLGSADVAGGSEKVYIARPVDAAFLRALDGTITSRADLAGIAVVHDNQVVGRGSTVLDQQVAAGTITGGLASAIASPSTSQNVTVFGRDAGAAVLPLGGGYLAVVTTPVSTVGTLWQPVALLLGLIVVSMFFIVLVVQLDLQRPLRRLDRAVAAMASQEYDVPVHVGGHDEIGRLASSFEDMRRALRATVVGSRARAVIASELNSPQPLETALQRVCNQLRQSSAGDAAFILVNHSEMADTFAIVDGVTDDLDVHQLLIDEGPIGAVYRDETGDPLLVCATPASTEYRIGVREVCAVPLHMGRSVLGVLGVSRESGGFSSADVSLVASSAEQVALALERYRFIAMVQRQASIDDLTGLYNHRFFVDYLGQQVALAERLNTPLAVLVIDLDHFKRVNDTHGHPVGDAVLHAFAQCLTSSVRRADLAARYGGEEFIVVMSNTTAADARHVAEKIRAAAEALVVEVDPSLTVRLTVSVGGAAYPEDTSTGRELLATADSALYDAKRAGRNRVCMAGNVDGESEVPQNVTTVRRRRSAK